MASRFWVGGTGNWSDTAHWAATSGGATGVAVPTLADDVTFDANSGTGTCTFDVNPNVQSISGETVTLVFDPLTSTLTASKGNDANPAIKGGHYYDIVLTGINLVIVTFLTPLSVHNLTALNAGNVRFEQNDSTLTVTGTLTLHGRSQTDRLMLSATNGNNSNRRVRISAAVVDLAYVDIDNVIASGVAAPWTGTSLGLIDTVTTTGVTTDPTRALFWVGGAGNWNDTNHWSTTSGGVGGAPIPLFQDNVTFDDNSFSGTGQVVTVNTVLLAQDITFATTKNPVWAFTVAGIGNGGNGNGGLPAEFVGATMKRHLTLSAGMTTTGTSTQLTWLTGSGVTANIDTKGVLISTALFFGQRAPEFSGIFKCLSNLSTTLGITLTIATATLDANGFDVTCAGITQQRSAIKLGSGTWTISGAWNNFNISPNTQIIPSTSTVRMVNNTAGQLSFDSGANTGASTCSFNNIEFAGSGAGGWLVVRSCTYVDFKITTVAPITITAGTTQTITSLTASGGTTTGTGYTMKSSVNGTAWNLSKPTGTVTVSFLSLQDSHAAGGATFTDAPQSMSVSGNTGWTFGGINVTVALTTQPTIIALVLAMVLRRLNLQSMAYTILSMLASTDTAISLSASADTTVSVQASNDTTVQLKSSRDTIIDQSASADTAIVLPSSLT